MDAQLEVFSRSMDAEVPAYLLEMKLWNLNGIVTDERTQVINMLERIRSSARNSNHSQQPNELPESTILDNIRRAEDVIDSFLAPCCSHKDLALGLSRFRQRTPETLVRAAASMAISLPDKLTIRPEDLTSGIDRWESKYEDIEAHNEIRRSLKFPGIDDQDVFGNRIGAGDQGNIRADDNDNGGRAENNAVSNNSDEEVDRINLSVLCLMSLGVFLSSF